MRKLVREFNEFSNTGATMTPIVYVRPNANSKHSSPHTRCRGQDNRSFKIIDLDGTEEQISLAKQSLLTLTHSDVVQFLHEQPSPNELHFWINLAPHAKKLLDTWCITIGNTAHRMGPAKFSMHQFRNRNKFVARSSMASKFTDKHILTNLAQQGAKDIYRRQLDDGETYVYVVFDSEISYRNAVTKSVWMNDINLKFAPQTHISSNTSTRRPWNSYLNSGPQSSSTSNKNNLSINSDNTYAMLDTNPSPNAYEATGANCTPLGNNRLINNIQDRPHRS